MKVIVMGCGRVGSQVSNVLVQQGHDVTVIDHKDTDAKTRLGPGFKGKLVSGLGFDHEILMGVGITTADAFIAASSSDNANIVAARIARNIFHVPRVVARLYDPRRAEIYKRLGLMTISTTTWGAERICELITHSDLDVVYNFGQGEVSMVVVEAPPSLNGKTVRELTVPGEINVVTITRKDHAILASPGTTLYEGDLIHLAVHARGMSVLEELLGMERRI